MTGDGRDSGLTLVELLVAAAITALIAPVLTSALVVGWRTTDATVERLGDNQDRLLVPSLFTRDVQAAESVTTSGAACTLAGDTLVVRFTWTETDPTGTATSSAASWVQTGGAPTLLERRFCRSGPALTSSVTAGHDAPTATVACRDAPGGATSACSASTTVVTMSITDTAGSTYSASGRRRVP